MDVWKYNFYEMLFYWLEYYIIDFTIQKKNADHEATKVERFIVPPVIIKKKIHQVTLNMYFLTLHGKTVKNRKLTTKKVTSPK